MKFANNDLDFVLKMNEIERHPAWREKMDSEAIIVFLAEEPPFTYVITQSSYNDYFLSYIRGCDRQIVSIHFKLTYHEKTGHVVYRNGGNIVFSSIDAFIRYKIKGKGVLPTSLFLKRIA